MKKLLIAVNDPALGDSLCRHAKDHFTLQICYNGKDAVSCLESFRPDALVLSLNLSHLDGLEVLRQSGAFLPPVVLALTSYCSPYTEHAAAQLGVGYIMLLPANPTAVIMNLLDMLAFWEKPQTQTIIRSHLFNLNIPTQRTGFQQLEVGIALFAEDTEQSLTCELYPSIAKVCNKTSGKQIERAISEAISDAWKHRDCHIWERYFPGSGAEDAHCPSNKKFIAKIANML